jgi:universal stress protein A
MKNQPILASKKKISTGSFNGRIKISYPRLRTILVPLDFSGKSRQALRYAAPVAQKFGGRIILLHVIASGAVGPSGSAPLVSDLKLEKDQAMKRLEATAASHVPEEVRGTNLVRVGSPHASILAIAEKLDVDMIVLTTRGRTGLKRFLLGSTAEQVVRHAKCPVLSVRRQ